MDYTVRAARPRLEDGWDDGAWAGTEVLEIASFRPEGSDHRPRTRARLAYDDGGLSGLFSVRDRYVRSVHTRFCEPVYCDSCVEIFLQPRPDKGYLNFEMNAGGTLLASHVTDHRRTPDGFAAFTRLTEEDGGRVGVRSSLPRVVDPEVQDPLEWELAFFVPITLLEKTGFAFDAEAVLAQITPKTRLIILNSPANPTGGVVPKAEIDKLAAGLERHPQVAVMSDEIYHRLLFDGREHATLFRYPALADRLIVLDGWSKTYAMTGWRLGWSVWPKSLVDQAERLAINCHSCVNAAAQWAGIAALEGPQDSVGVMRDAFAERRRIIVEGLNGIPGVSCVEPGGAFYAFPNIIRTNKDARTLQDLFLNEAGVATIAGTAFGAHGEGYLRFSYANSAENIREALKRIGRVLA